MAGLPTENNGATTADLVNFSEDLVNFGGEEEELVNFVGEEMKLVNKEGEVEDGDDGTSPSSSIETFETLNFGGELSKKIEEKVMGKTEKFLETFKPTELKEDPLPIKVHRCKISEFEAVGQGVRWASEYLYSQCCPLDLTQWALREVSDHLNEKHHVDSAERKELARIQAQELEPLQLMHAVVTVVDNHFKKMQETRDVTDDGVLLPSAFDEEKLCASSRGIFNISYHAMKNARRTMEDKVVVFPALPFIFNLKEDLSYFAVFDGHQGIEAANYGASQLHQFLIRGIRKGMSVPTALRSAFTDLDAAFIRKCHDEKIRSGTTALVAVFETDTLYLAWAGDSQASLHFGDGKVKQLVSAHIPTREDEKVRIKDLGGEVCELGGTFRVNGTLAVTRSIGDPEFKNCVVGDPEIWEIKRSDLGNEEYLILASDGLWDAMNAVQAGEFINRLILDGKAEDAAQILCLDAKSRGSQDNTSVIIAFLRPLNEISLSLSRRTTTPIEFEGILGKHYDTYCSKPATYTNGVGGNEIAQIAGAEEGEVASVQETETTTTIATVEKVKHSSSKSPQKKVPTPEYKVLKPPSKLKEELLREQAKSPKKISAAAAVEIQIPSKQPPKKVPSQTTILGKSALPAKLVGNPLNSAQVPKNVQTTTKTTAAPRKPMNNATAAPTTTTTRPGASSKTLPNSNTTTSTRTVATAKVLPKPRAAAATTSKNTAPASARPLPKTVPVNGSTARPTTVIAKSATTKPVSSATTKPTVKVPTAASKPVTTTTKPVTTTSKPVTTTSKPVTTLPASARPVATAKVLPKVRATNPTAEAKVTAPTRPQTTSTQKSGTSMATRPAAITKSATAKPMNNVVASKPASRTTTKPIIPPAASAVGSTTTKVKTATASTVTAIKKSTAVGTRAISTKVKKTMAPETKPAATETQVETTNTAVVEPILPLAPTAVNEAAAAPDAIIETTQVVEPTILPITEATILETPPMAETTIQPIIEATIVETPMALIADTDTILSTSETTPILEMIEPIVDATPPMAPIVEMIQPEVENIQPNLETPPARVETPPSRVENPSPRVETPPPRVKTPQPSVDTNLPNVETSPPTVETTNHVEDDAPSAIKTMPFVTESDSTPNETESTESTETTGSTLDVTASTLCGTPPADDAEVPSMPIGQQ